MIRFRLVASTVVITLLTLCARAETSAGLTLAAQLTDDSNHAAAALEYRRLAMDTASPNEAAALYWMAAYEYRSAGRYAQAERMLTRAETASPELETEIYLLQGENQRARRRLREAAFYLEGLTEPTHPEPVRTIASRYLAAVRLQMEDFDGARHALHIVPANATGTTLDAITTYEAGKDKSPVVGGLLGLIPGLGYAYCGEYANAFRSLILNGLCTWALVEFIEDEEWGGVALAGFAEVTFYSGSIYGGADAAVRHNRHRLNQCTDTIEGNASVTPDRATLPVLTLKYNF